jgi:hypothetical protein
LVSVNKDYYPTIFIKTHPFGSLKCLSNCFN